MDKVGYDSCFFLKETRPVFLHAYPSIFLHPHAHLLTPSHDLPFKTVCGPLYRRPFGLVFFSYLSQYPLTALSPTFVRGNGRCSPLRYQLSLHTWFFSFFFLQRPFLRPVVTDCACAELHWLTTEPDATSFFVPRSSTAPS